MTRVTRNSYLQTLMHYFVLLVLQHHVELSVVYYGEILVRFIRGIFEEHASLLATL